MNNYCTNSGCRPCPQPVSEHSCPCAEDLHRAFDLLCSPQLQALINFNAFAFVSGYYLLGSGVTTLPVGSAPADNLDAPAGTFSCSSNCSTAAASGLLYAPSGGEGILTTLSQASLCALSAVAFDASAETSQTENYQAVRQFFSRLLQPQQPCCRDGSLLSSLTTAAQQTVSLAAGPLLVENAAVLGEIGSVMVLANSTDNRFYFVCANKIDFIG